MTGSPRNVGELGDELDRRWSRELGKRRPDWQKLARLHTLLAEVEAALAAREQQEKQR